VEGGQAHEEKDGGPGGPPSEEDNEDRRHCLAAPLRQEQAGPAGGEQRRAEVEDEAVRLREEALPLRRFFEQRIEAREVARPVGADDPNAVPRR
jgi:hypothetical protein